MAVQTKMTADEFLRLPETSQRTELIDGEIIVTAPELDHQDILLNTAFALKNLVPDGKVRVSPVDVYLDDFNLVQPDVLWASAESKCVPFGKKYMRGAPELVVEVLSPSTALRDKGVKFRLYEAHGVHEYWIIDPAAQYVEVWQRSGEKFERHGVFGAGESFVSAALGQKAVEVSEIFKA